MAAWAFPADVAEDKRAFVSGLFGKLELTYHRWRCLSEFEGNREAAWYRVLAKDDTSVMIRSWSRLPHLGFTRGLHHLHFEEDLYWLTLGASGNREFFRRIG